MILLPTRHGKVGYCVIEQMQNLPTNSETQMLPQSSYPSLAYGISDVRAAGKKLAKKIAPLDALSTVEKGEIYEVFAIGNSWRDSHVYPMRSVRQSVSHRMRTLSCGGFTAARPKRMASIRRKLSTTSLHLDQIQDIAGCRAVLDNIEGAHRLVASIREQFPHRIRRESPYIEAPKLDGYRSHHFALDFTPDHSGITRRVELQVRTRLQHSWATAVEAVGLFLGQDLKHHNADPNWLRLFELISAEFARTENCPVPEGTPSRSECIKELRDLNARVGAASLLEDIKNLTHYAENYIFEKGRFYVIRYRSDRVVEVSSFNDPIIASEQLGGIEGQIEYGSDDSKVVMVEVDKVDKLVDAYPNYFGDVSLFVRNLKEVCLGKDAIEYSMAPQKLVAPRPVDKPDFSALRRRYTIW